MIGMMKKSLDINEFTNPNAMSWFKWILFKNEDLPALTYYFLSKGNATSARFFPLFDEMKSVRIVLLAGTHFRKLDRIQLWLLRLFIRITGFKQKKYKCILTTDVFTFKTKCNQVLNLDDPSYSLDEINKIRNWEKNLNKKGFTSSIVTTNFLTKEYLVTSGVISPIHIIEQGFRYSNVNSANKFKNFSCVYSSPYIHSKGDKQERHPSWGVDKFINVIIPDIIKLDPTIDIHLIGRLGKNAKKQCQNHSQVHLHGLKSIKENFEILSRCHLALYPRDFDNRRQVLKIYEYMGAGLPIVGFDLVDTSKVKEFNSGILVNKVEDFSLAVVDLKINTLKYKEKKANIEKFRNLYNWEVLAKRYDKLILSL
jgi:glycosyltransferase involved in cell wall biosynthesis